MEASTAVWVMTGCEETRPVHVSAEDHMLVACLLVLGTSGTCWGPEGRRRAG